MFLSRVSRKFTAIIKFDAHKITSHLLRESTDGELVPLKTRFWPEISAFFQTFEDSRPFVKTKYFFVEKKLIFTP